MILAVITVQFTESRFHVTAQFRKLFVFFLFQTATELLNLCISLLFQSSVKFFALFLHSAESADLVLSASSIMRFAVSSISDSLLSICSIFNLLLLPGFLLCGTFSYDTPFVKKILYKFTALYGNYFMISCIKVTKQVYCWKRNTAEIQKILY